MFVGNCDVINRVSLTVLAVSFMLSVLLMRVAPLLLDKLHLARLHP